MKAVLGLFVRRKIGSFKSAKNNLVRKSQKLYGLLIANPHLWNLRKFVDLRFVELTVYADRPPLNVVDIRHKFDIKMEVL